jgi:hypothetical protein
MTNDERIRQLELAVLHLSRAVNDLIAAQQKAAGVGGLMSPSQSESLQAAYKNVQTAVDALAIEQ